MRNEQVTEDRAVLGLEPLADPDTLDIEQVRRGFGLKQRTAELRLLQEANHIRMVLGRPPLPNLDAALVARGFPGMTSSELSRKAKMQLRDRFGRFVEMGGHISWKDSSGNQRPGRFMGVTEQGNVLVGDPETKTIETVAPKDIESIKAKATLDEEGKVQKGDGNHIGDDYDLDGDGVINSSEAQAMLKDAGEDYTVSGEPAPSGAPASSSAPKKASLKIPKPTDLPKPKPKPKTPVAQAPAKAYPNAPRDAEGRMIMDQKILDSWARWGPYSMEPHLEDSVDARGNPVKVLSKEQEARHDDIVNRSVEGIEAPEGRDPRALFMGGGSGSGKSSLLRQKGVPSVRGLEEYDKKGPGEAVIADVDGVRMELPGWKNPIGNGSTYTHSEAAMITTAIQDEAKRRGLDIVYDGTAGSGQKMVDRVEQVKSEGYDVDGAYTTLDTDEAMIRTITRGLETGRFLDLDYVAEIHKDVAQTTEMVKGKYGKFDLYDNDVARGEEPIPVVQDGRVVDQARYDKFAAKADEDEVEVLESAIEKTKTREFKPVTDVRTGEDMTAEEHRAFVTDMLNEALEDARGRKGPELEKRAAAAPGEVQAKPYGGAYPDWGRDAEGRPILPAEEAEMFDHNEHFILEDEGLVQSTDPATGQKVLVVTPEREAMHDEWIAMGLEGIDPPEGRGPIHTFLGGGPGSGKSSIGRKQGLPPTRELKHYGERPPGKAALAEADGFKVVNPRYSEDDPRSAEKAHAESTMVNRAFHRAAARAGVDVVIDGTGDGRIDHQIENLGVVPEGGTARAVYVTVPTSEALVRAMTRAIDERREISASAVTNSHARVSVVAPQMQDKYQSFELWNADVPYGHAAKPVFVNGEVTDQREWAQFLQKAEADHVAQLELAVRRAEDPNREYLPIRDLSPEEVRAATVRKLRAAHREALEEEEKREHEAALAANKSANELEAELRAAMNPQREWKGDGRMSADQVRIKTINDIIARLKKVKAGG